VQAYRKITYIKIKTKREIRMKTYSTKVEMKKLACHKKTRISSRIIEILAGKRSMMKMRKELLLNR
jgi:hypothetical protein